MLQKKRQREHKRPCKFNAILCNITGHRFVSLCAYMSAREFESPQLHENQKGKI